jgi:micrococcal nuclease
MRHKLFLAAAIIAAILVVVGTQLTGLFVAEERFVVERVIDGDTIVLEDGERVRLLGIDTTERGQKFWLEAKRFLEGKVLGKEIVLEKDVEDRDKYDRLLRWIFVGDEFVNLQLVKEGYARTLFYEDVKYRDALLGAESGARARGLRIWAFGDRPDMFCLGVYWLSYNAEGDDRKNLNGEFVEFRNSCTEPLDITGWYLEDDKGRRYVLSDFVIGNKSTFALHTGSGKDNRTDLYWGLDVPVWNNDGDRLQAWNARDELMLDYSY